MQILHRLLLSLLLPCLGHAETSRALDELGAEPVSKEVADRLKSAGPVQAAAPNRTMSAEQSRALELPSTESAELAWWRGSMRTRDERLAWWREGRFGMFVHWGPSALLGGVWQGRRYGGYTEHIQRMAQISMKDYREGCVSQFNPVLFDADAWVRAAKEAGMSYLIVTAKHHDGFAMYPSSVSHYNIVEATPFKRDPMAELRDACKRQGIRFGFYYSHAFDWGEADAPGNDWEYKNPGGDRNLYDLDKDLRWWVHNPAFLDSARGYVDKKAIPQLQELIKNYDPDILWFDTPHKLPPSENLRILRAVRTAKPDIVVNGRLVRDFGDYANTADRPAEFTSRPGDWEGVPTTNDSYGYSEVDRSHKPPAHFVRLLTKAVARGGNILLNVGPKGDGTIDSADLKILSSLGDWWRVNGESIRGCGRTPLTVQSWGESTRKGDSVLYLHVFNWPRDGKLVVGGLKSTPRSATLIGGEGASRLQASRLNPADLVLDLPATPPNLHDSVVKLEFDGAPAVDDAARLLAPAVPNLLRAFDGQISGGLSFAPGKVYDAYAEKWTSADARLAWPVRLNEAATYVVRLEYMAPKGSAGGTFALQVGEQRLTGTVQGDGKRKNVELGRVSLPPGTHRIELSGITIRGAELFRPFCLQLLPQ